MTELALFKFITDNDIEYHWSHDRKEIYAFINFSDLKEFNELIGDNIMEDGLDCVMKYRYICFEMIHICDHHAIDPENVFTQKDSH